MKTVEEYLKDPNRCPVCNSVKIYIHGDTEFPSSNVCLIDVACMDCEALWTETYELKTFEMKD